MPKPTHRFPWDVRGCFWWWSLNKESTARARCCNLTVLRDIYTPFGDAGVQVPRFQNGGGNWNQPVESLYLLLPRLPPSKADSVYHTKKKITSSTLQIVSLNSFYVESGGKNKTQSCPSTILRSALRFNWSGISRHVVCRRCPTLQNPTCRCVTLWWMLPRTGVKREKSRLLREQTWSYSPHLLDLMKCIEVPYFVVAAPCNHLRLSKPIRHFVVNKKFINFLR